MHFNVCSGVGHHLYPGTRGTGQNCPWGCVEHCWAPRAARTTTSTTSQWQGPTPGTYPGTR
eukprot:3779663-Rhodomonas_salina.1